MSVPNVPLPGAAFSLSTFEVGNWMSTAYGTYVNIATVWHRKMQGALIRCTCMLQLTGHQRVQTKELSLSGSTHRFNRLAWQRVFPQMFCARAGELVCSVAGKVSNTAQALLCCCVVRLTHQLSTSRVRDVLVRNVYVGIVGPNLRIGYTVSEETYTTKHN
jgi:hypothetical protein